MTQPPQDPQHPQEPGSPAPSTPEQPTAPSWDPSSSYPPAPPAGQGEGWGQPGYGVPGETAPGGYHTYGAPTPYAEWIKRVGAYLIDIAVLIPAYVVMLVATPFMGSDNGALAAIGFVVYLVGLVGVIGLAVWNIVLRQGRTGWSIGKQVLGIRLIAEKTGEPLGPGLTFVRALAHILDQLPCYLGYLWPLWDAKKQTFADKIMGTVVIEQAKPSA